MILQDERGSQVASRPQTDGGRRLGRQQQPEQREQEQPINVGQSERAVSVAAGTILTLTGLSRRSIPGLFIAAVGGAMAYRGVTGHCPAYGAMGVDTARPQQSRGRQSQEETFENGIHVEQAFLINRSPEDLYKYWRNFENLPRIMTHLESVRVMDDRRSHWVVEAPKIAGGKVEWDAEITRDEPNNLISWRSLPGSEVETRGEIRFSKAMGDRGTEVHVFMDYVPPGGRLGHWVATLFGSSPRRLLRDDLRNFKRIMEVGEILTINGQPKGTCTGVGERYSE
jgi:uncharacterized membrane protein